MTAEQVTAIVTAVDFSTIIVGIATLGAALMVPRVTRAGFNMLKSMVR